MNAPMTAAPPKNDAVDQAAEPVQTNPCIVIVGAGFAGLACAKALGGAPARVTVIDRRNHHLFQPLLYQVATAALSPADIAAPIRSLLARHRNIEVLLGEVTGVDEGRREVRLVDGGCVAYDTLILATGSVYNYFGHDDWAARALDLKTIASARNIRARLLAAFEAAERTNDPIEREALMTTIIIGGGPTGVEMAGAVAELARNALVRDFRHIDPSAARVVLMEAGSKVLAAFPDPLPAYAADRLEAIGVRVMLGAKVEAIGPDTVTASGQAHRAATIIWAAGIRAAEAARWIDVGPDRSGKIQVAPDLSVPGHREVYAMGDIAALEQDGRPLPALAQVAKQQGAHLGRALRRRLDEGGPVTRFHFSNRGDSAVIGRHAAVYSLGRFKLRGASAWLLWAIVHVILLNGFDKRVLVVTQWLWRYLTFERGARIID